MSLSSLVDVRPLTDLIYPSEGDPAVTTSYARAVTTACVALQRDPNSIPARFDLHSLIKTGKLSHLLIDQSPAAADARAALIDFMGAATKARRTPETAHHPQQVHHFSATDKPRSQLP